MIRVFFTEDGYYVAGENVEITRCCSPALTDRGDRIFQPLHHEYKVLYLALCELRNANITDDVMVYGHSRIIDEINGAIHPLDTTCERWLNVLRRNVIPSIRAVVFFRKKATRDVQGAVSKAQQTLSPAIDLRTVEDITASETERQDALVWQKKRKAIARLRTQWFGG